MSFTFPPPAPVQQSHCNSRKLSSLGWLVRWLGRAGNNWKVTLLPAALQALGLDCVQVCAVCCAVTACLEQRASHHPHPIIYHPPPTTHRPPLPAAHLFLAFILHPASHTTTATILPC